VEEGGEEGDLHVHLHVISPIVEDREVVRHHVAHGEVAVDVVTSEITVLGRPTASIQKNVSEVLLIVIFHESMLDNIVVGSFVSGQSLTYFSDLVYCNLNMYDAKW